MSLLRDCVYLRLQRLRPAGAAFSPIVGWAAGIEQALRLDSYVGGIDAGLMEHGVFALPDLHGKTARLGLAHGHTAQGVSGPDGEH